MTIKNITTTLITFFCLMGSAHASGPIAVIVHSSNTQELSIQDIRAIYSDTMSSWNNGQKIAVYTLPVLSSSSETFWQATLHMSALQAASDESNRRITNTAKNKQKQKNPRSLVAIVSKNPKAIGFIKKNQIEGNDKVRVVLILE